MGAAAPYRHSRVSGNPDGTAKDRPVTHQAFLDSRLRGNDGRGTAGMTVGVSPYPATGGVEGNAPPAALRGIPLPRHRRLYPYKVGVQVF